MAKVTEVVFFIPDDEDEIQCHEYNPYHDLLLGIVQDLDVREIDGVEFIMPYREQVWCG